VLYQLSYFRIFVGSTRFKHCFPELRCKVTTYFWTVQIFTEKSSI